MLFFIDESGHDRKLAPYEVLAGIAVRERDLWNLIQAIKKLEIEFFGLPLASVGVEMKGGRLLKKKAFRLANQGPRIERGERQKAAKIFLEKGWRQHKGENTEPPKNAEYTAYGQAVLDFVSELLKLVAGYHVKTFAAMVTKDALRSENPNILRKDYAYLFERFYYYLEEVGPDEMGLVAFDELEKAQSRILLDQMQWYFLNTGKGLQRSSRIVPEPFFVHSDLTTMVQLADIVGYCLNWGARFNQKMIEPVRPEMKPYAAAALDMQYRGKHVGEHGELWDNYGVIFLDDLRPKKERE